jgi:hypothetical protein
VLTHLLAAHVHGDTLEQFKTRLALRKEA